MDVRVAEDSSTDPIIPESLYAPLPLNINDVDIHPSMEELPSPRRGRSEMLFSLVRFQFAHFSRRVMFSSEFCENNEYPLLTDMQKCKAIDEFQERLEENWLWCCDLSDPLGFMTALSSRLIVVKFKLAVFKPTEQGGGGYKGLQDYQGVCEEVLRHARVLRGYEAGRKWLWLVQRYVEWDALMYLLLDVCAERREMGRRVAEVVDEMVGYWRGRVDGEERWVYIEELRGRALGI